MVVGAGVALASKTLVSACCDVSRFASFRDGAAAGGYVVRYAPGGGSAANA